MALTNTPLRIFAGMKIGPGGTSYDNFIESATQSWKAGAPVILSSGKAVESTSPISSTNKMVGIANQKASGTTNAEVLVISPATDQEYEGTLSDATAGTHTLAQTDIGLIYPLLKDSVSAIWYLDANATATDGALILRPKNMAGPKDVIGSVDARVIFKITRPAILGG